MAASKQQAATFYDNLLATYPAKPVRRGGGGLNYSGNLWPPLTITTTPPPLPNGTVLPAVTRPNPGAALKRKDAEVALEQARKMVTQAYLAAKGAISGSNEDAIPVMEKWFGPRPLAPMQLHERDWWTGAATIIGVIEAFLTSAVNLYYRGSEVQGRPNDYPGKVGNLTAHDVSGYAETYAGTMNSVIGLCELFFEKQVGTGQARMKLSGYDSVGGTLVHELSHNLCRTRDHDMPGGGSAYGTDDCLILRRDRVWRAWWNADNIEYFCEEILYGTGTPTVVTTGATTGVSNLRTIFGP